MSSSYFSHSTNCLQDNTFITATNYINQPGSAKGPFEHLLGNICADAIHNSDARCDAPKCHPQTRKAVQGEIINWMIDGEDDAEPKTILWLSGPAGAGKTAIAGSLAETCEDKSLLAGSFFFSSFSTEEERRSKRCLVATLVYCMLQHEGMQPLRPVILSIIERDPAIFRKRLQDQLKALVMRPFQNITGDLSVSSIPKVIIVDGLDEVEAADSRQLEDKLEARERNESDQLDILSALLEVAKHPSVPFRIVVVSRPERAIRDFFDSEDAKVVTRHIFLDDKYNPASDIMLYLKAKFAEVRRRYRLPPSWPTEKALTELVNRASGQFVYASTVVRFNTQNGTIPPQERLERILSLRLHGGQSHPLASLDALYLHILMSSPDPPLAARWLGVIDYGLGPLHAPFVRKCLEDYRGQAEHLLENLASLVHLPPAQDYFSPYRLFHKSLSDFLQSSRCNEELRSPFLHGRGHFVHRRFADILKRKAPAVSFERTDWPWHTFMCQFLDCMAFLDFFKTWSMEPTAKQVLATCDVAWWVGATIVAFMRAERPSPTNPSPDPVTGLHRASLILCKLMLQIHMQCPRYDSFASCSPACKHWRSGILRTCVRLGWKVPNAVALLRGRMATLLLVELVAPAGEKGVLKKAHSLWAYFQPPPQVSSPPREPASTVAQDFEAWFTTADQMYSRLPSDWKVSYRQGLAEGQSPYNVLRATLQMIGKELGIDVEDVEVTDPWPSRPQILSSESHYLSQDPPALSIFI